MKIKVITYKQDGYSVHEKNVDCENICMNFYKTLEECPRLVAFFAEKGVAVRVNHYNERFTADFLSENGKDFFTFDAYREHCKRLSMGNFFFSNDMLHLFDNDSVLLSGMLASKRRCVSERERLEDERRKEREEEERKEREEEEKAYNEELSAYIESLKNGENFDNDNIYPPYKDDSCVIVELLKHFGVWESIPLKTKGWMKNICEVKFRDGKIGYSYYAKKNGRKIANSTVAINYLMELQEKAS